MVPTIDKVLFTFLGGVASEVFLFLRRMFILVFGSFLYKPGVMQREYGGKGTVLEYHWRNRVPFCFEFPWQGILKELWQKG